MSSPLSSPPMPPSPLRCLVVDDDPTTLLVMEQCIARTPTLQAVGFFATPHEALAFLRANAVDVLFLDVEMPLLSGLELLQLRQQLPHLRRSPHTVLITASAEYGVAAFGYAVVDYLLKPIGYPRFLQAVRKVAALAAAHSPACPEPVAEFIFVKTGSQMARVNFADVQYLEARGSYVHLVLQHQKLIVFSTLRSLKERFPITSFFTIHRSFVVNIRHIDVVEAHEVLINGKRLPVSSLLRAALLQQLNIL